MQSRNRTTSFASYIKIGHNGELSVDSDVIVHSPEGQRQLNAAKKLAVVNKKMDTFSSYLVVTHQLPR